MYTRTESDGLHGNRLMIRSQPETEMGTSRSRLMVPEVRCSHDRKGQKMWQKDPIRFRRGLFFFFARVVGQGFHVTIVVNIQRVPKIALCLLIIVLLNCCQESIVVMNNPSLYVGH